VASETWDEGGLGIPQCGAFYLERGGTDRPHNCRNEGNLIGAGQEGLKMSGIVGVGVYLLLGLVIAVGIIAVFHKEPTNKSRLGSSAPLAALAVIAEEAHRHSPPDLNPLPWTPASPLVPVGDDSLKAIPTLAELSERLDVLEARLDQIAGVRETSFNTNSETVRLS
jgi:hypothetical protein